MNRRFAHRLKLRSGIAMVTVSMILIFMMIIAIIALKLMLRGTGVTGSSRRYLTVFDAAESGIEVGMLNIESAAASGTVPTSGDVNVGSQTVTLVIEHIFTGVVAGANIVFGGTGYEGVGTGISSGGTAVYYRIESNARGPVEEQTILETAYRKIVGISAR